MYNKAYDEGQALDFESQLEIQSTSVPQSIVEIVRERVSVFQVELDRENDSRALHRRKLGCGKAGNC